LEKSVNQSRKGPAQSCHTLHVFDRTDSELQSVSFDELRLGFDGSGADIRARALAAKIAEVYQMPQFLGGGFFPSFPFPVIESVELGKERTRRVHKEPAYVTIGTGIQNGSGRFLRISAVHLTVPQELNSWKKHFLLNPAVSWSRVDGSVGKLGHWLSLILEI
jgi:hypothetical protein